MAHDIDGSHPVGIVKGTCGDCGIRYSYNTWEIDTDTGVDVWHLMVPRNYLMPTNQFVVTRALLQQFEQRVVVQQVGGKFLTRPVPCNPSQVTFQSEGRILGIHRRQLRAALDLDWVMRHERETRPLLKRGLTVTQGYHCFLWHKEVIAEAVNSIRRDGLPGWQHSCLSAGVGSPQHVTKQLLSLRIDSRSSLGEEIFRKASHTSTRQL